VDALDIFVVEACPADLHPRPEHRGRRKLFDSEANGLGGCRKATILKPLALTTSALCQAQLGGCGIVEYHKLAFSAVGPKANTSSRDAHCDPRYLKKSFSGQCDSVELIRLRDQTIVYALSPSFASRELSLAISLCDRMMVLWFASI
jgi:hypothetical protein